MNKNIKGVIPKWRFTEFMNSGEWEEKKIETFGEFINGLSGKKSTDFGNGEPYIQYKQVFDKSYIDFSECGKVSIENDEKQNAVQKGDILFTTSSETPDEVGFASVVVNKPHKKTYLNSFCFILRPFDLENTIPTFFSFLFQSSIYRRSVSAIAQGSTRYNLSKLAFRKLKIPIPPKPEEQQKIAYCLSSIDNLISAEEKKLSLLNDYKKGWMQKLFPAEGKTVPEWRFPEFKDRGEWEKLNIKKACYPPYSGGTPVTSKKEYYNGDIPFIRSGEIGKEKTELFLTSEGLDNSSAKMIEKGDVLMALYGANSGEVAISPIKGAINQAILCLRHKNNNAFLYHYLAFKKNWIVRTYIQGGQGNLSGEIVKSIELCSPQEPEEQNIIAKFLSGIDDLISTQTDRIEALKQHKKALMQGLFPVAEEV